MMLRPEELKVFKIVETPDQVLDAIEDFQKEIEAGVHEHLKTTKGDFSL
jgi:alkanesulfonate monooxygenase SsuD/methylene tetrahydromethanopterin reductase-like flavin-dependent oxidoreductase (luciferase family)